MRGLRHRRPPSAALDAFGGAIEVAFENQAEVRRDSLPRNSRCGTRHYRGRFAGSYQIGTESGVFGWFIRPEGRWS